MQCACDRLTVHEWLKNVFKWGEEFIRDVFHSFLGLHFGLTFKMIVLKSEKSEAKVRKPVPNYSSAGRKKQKEKKGRKKMFISL